MRLFLDANILFTAAHHEGGMCRALFRLADAGRCELVASSFAIDEARRNLAKKAPARLPVLTGLLEQVTRAPEPPPALVERVATPLLPAKDAPILAAAAAAGCTILVTGDRRHFGYLYGQRPAGVLVASPAEAFDLMLPG